MAEVLLTISEVCTRLGVTRNTVDRYHKAGILTKIKPSARVVRYRLSEIEQRQKEWADGRG
jgi:predicted site-specific integrase-resolvase